jgi:hypothetical protein
VAETFRTTFPKAHLELGFHSVAFGTPRVRDVGGHNKGGLPKTFWRYEYELRWLPPEANRIWAQIRTRARLIFCQRDISKPAPSACGEGHGFGDVSGTRAQLGFGCGFAPKSGASPAGAAGFFLLLFFLWWGLPTDPSMTNSEARQR